MQNALEQAGLAVLPLLARCGRCRFNTRAAHTLTRNQSGFALQDTNSSGDALREGIFGTLCLALEEQKTMIIERLKSGVITVGDGRGFVVEGAGERLVITAAHCVPSLPLALPLFRARGAHLRAAPRPPWGGATFL